MFKFSAILLVALFANYTYAKYAALDHCTPLLGKFVEPYSDFTPTTTVNGVTTLNFYVISKQTPHIQLNAEPKPTSDYYELVMDNGRNEIRRRRYGASYIVLGSATRNDLLDQFEPVKVRFETRLQSDGKRLLQIFVKDETTPYLSGVDSLPQVQPLYQAFGSYSQQSKYFYNCKAIPAPVCPALESQISRQLTLIASLESDVSRLLKIISDAYTQSISKVTTFTSTVVTIPY